MNRVHSFSLFLLSAILFQSISANNASAEFIQLLGTLPTKRSAAPYVLGTQIEILGGSGYQPVKLNFTPAGKSFGRDHQIQVRLTPSREYGTKLEYSHQTDITLPEGATSHSVTVFVPHYFPWDRLSVTLLEDGQFVETGKTSYGVSLHHRNANQHVSVGVLIDKTVNGQLTECPDIRTLNVVLGDGPLPEDVSTPRLKPTDALNAMYQIQPCWVQYRTILLSDTHENWLGHSQLDLIIASATLLEKMRTEHPARYVAIEKWVATGGNLWVYAIGKQPLPLTDRLSMLPLNTARILFGNMVKSEMSLNGPNDTSELSYDSWNSVYKTSQNGVGGFKSRSNVYQKLQKAKHPFVGQQPSKEISAKLKIGTFGLGKVLLIDDDDPFPGSFQFWHSAKKLFEDELNWNDRYGIDIVSGNDNYWTWLIPSVGQPPVKTFVMLNVLFALLIGPFCYFFFRNRDRLYLLYFAAPATAFLITGSLFFYAIASDGLTTKTRSRQLTWIDPTSGYTIHQSRQTYYATLGERDGINVSDQTAIYPVSNVPLANNYYRQQASKVGVIEANGGRQKYGQSFLPPREQVQYISTNAKETKETVSFDFASAEKTVKNDLQYVLERIVVRDANGNYFEAKNVPAGGSGKLTSCVGNVVKEILGPDVLPPLTAVPMLQRNNDYSYGNSNYETGVEVSMLEKRIDDWSNTLLPKGTFLGVAPLDRDRLGVDGIKVLNSVQLIMGETK